MRVPVFQVLLTLLLSASLGMPTAVSAEPDSDQDGVADSRDVCPDTVGEALLANGCGLGEKVPLENALFDPGSTELSLDLQRQLYKLFLLLRQNCHCVLEIQGHADRREAPGRSEALAAARAKTAADFLQALGVPEEQLYPEGYGDLLAVAVNSSAVGRAQNRRIELRVMQ